jgi:hypothetical protein
MSDDITVKVGQIWQDRDKRRTRHVRVLEKDDSRGEPAFRCETVENAADAKGGYFWMATKWPRVVIRTRRFLTDFKLEMDVKDEPAAQPAA